MGEQFNIDTQILIGNDQKIYSFIDKKWFSKKSPYATYQHPNHECSYFYTVAGSCKQIFL